jgi:hypothetical protein
MHLLLIQPKKHQRALPPFLKKGGSEGRKLRTETRKEHRDLLGILFAKKRDIKNHDFLSLSHYDFPFPGTPPPNHKTPRNHTHTKTLYNTYPHHISPHPIPHATMPLKHAVMYQAFREITNFTRNNGDHWDKFCTNTACSTRKAVKPPPS